MSHESLVEYETVIVKRAAQLVDRLKEESRKKEKAVDIVQWINFFTFDFMGDMACVHDLPLFALECNSPLPRLVPIGSAAATICWKVAKTKKGCGIP